MRWLKTHGLEIGLLGATLATAGDVLLLLRGTGWADSFSPSTPGLLLIGTLLGVGGIALYPFGYSARAAQFRPEVSRAADWLNLGGPIFAATGAAVHGATGLSISASGGNPPATSPYTGIVQAGSVLVGLWALGATFFLVMALADWAGCSNWKERLLNPLLVTLGIVAGSLFLPEDWGNVVGPASVNIAHVIFFGGHRKGCRGGDNAHRRDGLLLGRAPRTDLS